LTASLPEFNLGLTKHGHQTEGLMASFTITPLTDYIGAEVVGLRFRAAHG
jgi:hypothetical protein